MVALAPCGTTLTEDQAALLRELPGAAGGIVAASDADPAGRDAVDRAWHLLRRQRSPGPLLTAEFSAGADPADLLLRTTAGRSCGPRCSGERGPVLDAAVRHRFARLIERHPRLLEDIDISPDGLPHSKFGPRERPGMERPPGTLASLPDIADDRYSR
ncbi:toprim domain-containing protein [Micromonospora sp. DT201]|uniref:toprim domain-containing protein n=1 Tax=Micromonospora sp. DT201 TaxID=3393442 RepID=UPI003CEF7BB3